MKKAAIILILFVILARVIGFGRDMILSYYFGASAISDAYLISLTVPTTVISLLGMAVAMNYIPMVTAMEQTEGASRASFFTSGLCGLLIVVCGLMAGLVFIFAQPVVLLFAAGFQGDTLETAVLFTRIGAAGILFSGIVSMLNAQLQVRNRFFMTALTECILNGTLVLFIILGAHASVWVLALGISAGPAAQLFIAALYLRRKNCLVHPSFYLKDEDLKKIILLTLPVLVSISVDQVNAMVDRAFASGIAVGGVSAVSYAFKVSGFIHGIFAFSIGTAAYPALAKMTSSNDVKGLNGVVRESIGSINLIVIPAAVGVMVFAQPVVALLFGRGSFDTAGIAMTADALFYFSIGLAAMGISDILSRAFYARNDTKTPLVISLFSIGLNAALNALFSTWMGIGGLALATSISLVFRTILLFVLYKKNIGKLGGSKLAFQLG
ncbi:MAG: murein biosynthesis integral membrane protein MurJ, partial [Eubacteriales bacterium]